MRGEKRLEEEDDDDDLAKSYMPRLEPVTIAVLFSCWTCEVAKVRD